MNYEFYREEFVMNKMSKKIIISFSATQTIIAYE